MTKCACPWCSPDAPEVESRFTWEYVDTVRAFATEQGTVDEPNVQRLLTLLESGARLLHGERTP